MSPSSTILSVIAIALLAAQSEVHAGGELDVAVGLDVASSSDSDDGAGLGHFRVGYFFRDWLGATLIGRAGRAGIDMPSDRAIATLIAGVEARRPLGKANGYLRLGFLHQHEAPWDALEDDTFATSAGVSEAIHHRTGASTGVGLELPVVRIARGHFYAGLDIGVDALVDRGGPGAYYTVGAMLGFRVTDGEN